MPLPNQYSAADCETAERLQAEMLGFDHKVQSVIEGSYDSMKQKFADNFHQAVREKVDAELMLERQFARLLHDESLDALHPYLLVPREKATMADWLVARDRRDILDH